MPEAGMLNARLCVRLAIARATQSVIPFGTSLIFYGSIGIKLTIRRSRSSRIQDRVRPSHPE